MPLILIFAIFYFVMIRPEGKKRREREALLKTIKKGDKVMTTGGMYATVVNVQEDVITLQAGDNVRLRFTRQAIQNLIQDEPSAESK
jgi:preprotein translocase subunit YajC